MNSASLIWSDREVPPGTIGDLLVAGDSTAPYYWHRPQLTADRMRGKWFFTGDKYWRDNEGYYWYAGRSDDMFRVSGQWISPAEVESALIEHECVLEAAVVAYREVTGLPYPQGIRRTSGRDSGDGRSRSRTAGVRQTPDHALQIPATYRVHR